MKDFFRALPGDAAYDIFPSPIGLLVLVASDLGLHALLWESDLKKHQAEFSLLHRKSRHPVILKARRQLKEYFLRKRKSFDLPISIVSGTKFQRRAWKVLSEIPFGSTLSYKDQAQKLGDAKKARAVGTANSRNPISIIVPCHRVIASNGDLSGFGGGKHVKRYLIDLENRSRSRSFTRQAPNGFVK